MAKKKPASLMDTLLARKGEAKAIGYAASALDPDQAMDAAGTATQQAPPSRQPMHEERETQIVFTPDRRPGVVTSSLPADDDPPARPYPPLMKKRILIVEDNELDMKLFRDLLELHGCSTLRARDGREALQLAQARRPDLILMDMYLPGASGLEVTRWFKEDDDLRSIPVIAATAHVMGGEGELLVNQGCESYIAKPISISAFLRACARALPTGEPAAERQ